MLVEVKIKPKLRFYFWLRMHRAIADILIDLALARQYKEWADKDLAEVLANLTF
ncbi:hypothetical protein [Nostoc sphaeroides]|uniref:N6 adenine-specific DNA methyltransferase n=1 Tax=Nostoc sphaeroides CCNUC1 TaxID=2653204 RepID=A0A5P8VVF7_9NOSO|nr:hypothetical protein [Nostoc sphaeroides]QFS44375.1 N6 adenine-specific DNA methyltransferase [Nostoc sphaeroides CCNUC1]